MRHLVIYTRTTVLLCHSLLHIFYILVFAHNCVKTISNKNVHSCGIAAISLRQHRFLLIF